MLKVKLKAFLIHFFISIVLAVCSLFVVYGVWYPPPLDRAVGVSDIFLLLLIVDVFIGPVLTFVVFDIRKKALRFDLAVIVIFQLLAFAYGFSVVAEGRPAWLVYNYGRFDLIQSYQIDERGSMNAAPEYRKASFFGPRFVFAEIPDMDRKHDEVVFDAVFRGVDVPQRPELFKPIGLAVVKYKKDMKPLADLRLYNDPSRVNDVLSVWPAADGFLPMMAKTKPMTVLINSRLGEIVAVVDLKPW